MKNRFLILFCFLLGFSCSSQELKTYGSLYNHWDINGFLKQFNRSIDSSGVVTQKGEYHALIISFYGIINYHEFLKTNDSLYYKRVVDQYKYFSDTSKIMFFDNGESVGLPYLKPFNGLAAPWFSGMTQGTAVSYLLRYYNLTRDDSALSLTKKLINFMIKPESEGGTIGTSKEGCLWIEEYPNCTKSKSVLNGFINGLIGLSEYLEYYPEDENVRKLHDECYDAMFQSLKEYDTYSWTSYNRNGKSISNGYMRYQISEFDQLLNIYNDDRFLRQMKIWSRMSINKLCREITFYKHPKFQYAQNIKEVEDSKFLFNEQTRFSNGLNDIIDSFPKLKVKRIKNLKIKLNEIEHYFIVEFNGETNLDKLKVKAINNDNEVAVKYESIDDKLVFSSLNGFDEIIISFGRKIKKSNGIVALKVYDKYKYDLPFFGVVNIKDDFALSKGEEYRIVYNAENLVNAQVFYRYANSEAELKKEKFQIENYFNLTDFHFIAPETGIYEFFISYSICTPSSFIEQFNLIEEY